MEQALALIEKAKRYNTSAKLGHSLMRKANIYPIHHRKHLS